MNVLRKVSVGVLLVALTAGCAASPVDDGDARTPSNRALSSLYVSDVDVANEAPYPIEFDWGIDTSDPRAIAEVSPLIVKGAIRSIDHATVDQVGLINTVYSVEVSETYKGEAPSDVIQVSLPGGTTTLGEYIAALDERGLYERIFAQKSDALLREKGIDPESVVDPRDDDPNKAVTHNLGSNPTSESFLRENAPEAFVFYLDKDAEGVYFASVFNHSLKYVKDGTVYSATASDEATKPFPEAQLTEQ